MARRINVNAAGASHAASLIGSGKIKDSASWSPPSAESENAYVQANGLAAFGRWHLGVDPDASEDTKGRFAFVFTSDWQKVDLSGLRACVTRAAQSGHAEVESRARSLLQAAKEKADKAFKSATGSMRETKYLQAVKIDTGGMPIGKFSGYGSISGNLHPTSHPFLGPGWQDRVDQGAFRHTLAEFSRLGAFPAMLFNHDIDNVIGAYDSIVEDSQGLKVTGSIASSARTPAGADIYELVKMGGLSGMSIGFSTVAFHLDEDKRVRTIEEVKLHDVSVVSIPGNPAARIEDVKGLLESPKLFERQLRDALGLTREQAKALLAGGWKALSRDAEEASTDPVRDAPACSLRDAASYEEVSEALHFFRAVRNGRSI